MIAYDCKELTWDDFVRNSAKLTADGWEIQTNPQGVGVVTGGVVYLRRLAAKAATGG